MSTHCSSFTRYLSIGQPASYCLPPDTRRRQLTAPSSAVRTEFTEFTCPKDVGLERPIEELSVNWTPRPPATLHTLDAHHLFVDRCNHCGSSLSLLSRSVKSLISCRPSAGSRSLVFYRNFGVPSELCRQINLIRFTAQIELSDCLDFCIICVYAGRARERNR